MRNFSNIKSVVLIGIVMTFSLGLASITLSACSGEDGLPPCADGGAPEWDCPDLPGGGMKCVPLCK